MVCFRDTDSFQFSCLCSDEYNPDRVQRVALGVEGDAGRVGRLERGAFVEASGAETRGCTAREKSETCYDKSNLFNGGI